MGKESDTRIIFRTTIQPRHDAATYATAVAPGVDHAPYWNGVVEMQMDPEELTEPEYRLIEIVRRDPGIIEGLIDYARGLVPDDEDDADAVDEFLSD